MKMCTKLMEEFLKELKNVSVDAREINKTVNLLKEKITKISSRIETLEKENTELKPKIFELKKENDELNDHVAELGQYLRRMET